MAAGVSFSDGVSLLVCLAFRSSRRCCSRWLCSPVAEHLHVMETTKPCPYRYLPRWPKQLPHDGSAVGAAAILAPFGRAVRSILTQFVILARPATSDPSTKPALRKLPLF